MIRIFINEVVFEQCSRAGASYASSSSDCAPVYVRILNSTIQNAEAMARDICMSVDMSRSTPGSSVSQVSSAEASKLIWPLAAAGESDLVFR